MSYGSYSRQPADDRPYRVAVGLVGLGLITLVLALSGPTSAPPPAPVHKVRDLFGQFVRTNQTRAPLVVHRMEEPLIVIVHESVSDQVAKCTICQRQGVKVANVPAFASE